MAMPLLLSRSLRCIRVKSPIDLFLGLKGGNSSLYPVILGESRESMATECRLTVGSPAFAEDDGEGWVMTV